MDKSLQIIVLAACAIFGVSANLHAQDADADVMVLSKDGKLSLPSESKTTVISQPLLANTLNADTGSDAGSAFRFAGILLILGGLAGWAYLAKRNKLTKLGKGGATQGFEVMERLSLGPKRELLLVRSGPRILVLASLEQDLKLVTSIAQSDWLMHYDDQALLSIMEQAATRNHREVQPKRERILEPEERPTRPARPISKADNFDFSAFDRAVKKQEAEPEADSTPNWNWPAEKTEKIEKPERSAAPRKNSTPARPGGLWESA